MSKQAILNLLDNIEQHNNSNQLEQYILAEYIKMLRLGVKELKTCDCD